MKIPALIILGSTSSVIGSDADRAFILALAGVVALVVYRLRRKFKKDPLKTWKQWFDRNIVECLLGMLIAPGILRMILGIVKEVVGKL